MFSVAHDEGYVYLLVEKPSDWDFTKEQLYIGGLSTCTLWSPCLCNVLCASFCPDCFHSFPFASGFDVIPSKGSSKPKNAPASFSLGLENLMVINGPTNGSLTVKSDYDIYFWWYGTTAEPVPVEWKDYGIGESDRFNEEQMISVRHCCRIVCAERQYSMSALFIPGRPNDSGLQD